jgi:hypothetical protein
MEPQCIKKSFLSISSGKFCGCHEEVTFSVCAWNPKAQRLGSMIPVMPYPSHTKC